MKKLVIFGLGPFGELAQHYFRRDSPYRVVGFTVDAKYLGETTFKALPVVAFEEVERIFPPVDHDLFVAVGIQKVNRQRAAKVVEAEAKGYRLPSFVSSRAQVEDDLVLGPNSMVMEHAMVQPFVTIGKSSIVWSTSRIGFHSRIGDHCWLVGPLLGESVVVGDYSFVGLNATIASAVKVGEANVIGAGALVLRSTLDGAVYKGNESRPSRVPSHRLLRI